MKTRQKNKKKKIEEKNILFIHIIWQKVKNIIIIVILFRKLRYYDTHKYHSFITFITIQLIISSLFICFIFNYFLTMIMFNFILIF